MAKLVLTVDSYSQAVNARQVRDAALEGRTVPPVFEERSRGDVFDVDADEAKRLRAIGAAEEPGESQQREQDRLKAEQDRLKAEQDALAERAKQAGSQARSAAKG